MDILGIGPLELIFILIIALIVLGPKDMAKGGRTIGRYLRQIMKSPTWHAVQNTSKELRNLPNKLMRDAGMEEDLKDIGSIIPSAKDLIPDLSPDEDGGNKETKEKQPSEGNKSDDISDWVTPPKAAESPEPPQSTSESNE